MVGDGKRAHIGGEAGAKDVSQVEVSSGALVDGVAQNMGEDRVSGESQAVVSGRALEGRVAHVGGEAGVRGGSQAGVSGGALAGGVAQVRGEAGVSSGSQAGVSGIALVGGVAQVGSEAGVRGWRQAGLSIGDLADGVTQIIGEAGMSEACTAGGVVDVKTFSYQLFDCPKCTPHTSTQTLTGCLIYGNGLIYPSKEAEYSEDEWLGDSGSESDSSRGYHDECQADIDVSVGEWEHDGGEVCYGQVAMDWDRFRGQPRVSWGSHAEVSSGLPGGVAHVGGEAGVRDGSHAVVSGGALAGGVAHVRSDAGVSSGSQTGVSGGALAGGVAQVFVRSHAGVSDGGVAGGRAMVGEEARVRGGSRLVWRGS